MIVALASVLRVPISAFAILYFSAASAAALPQAHTVENSPAGLKAQLEGILNSKKGNESNATGSLLAALKMPGDATWFVDTFGEEKGTKLAARYQKTWDTFHEHMVFVFENLRKQKAHEADIEDALGNNSHAHVDSVLAEAKAPLTMYYATAPTKHAGVFDFPGYYVYVQGAFRVVNWEAFYALPNQRPGRIRIGGNVLASQLVRQVPPIYPDEVKNNHVQGTVTLHAVIATDGTILQLEYVSGPKELLQSAMDAVKQWRYKPTLLNDDPVEVDSTIKVVYSLH
jgi:TonB family protein